ncbi:hypothetical protein D9M69_498090 [compost metagenome]
MLQQAQQRGRTEVGRLHAAHHVGAVQAGADLLAHRRAAAVATDEVLAADAHCAAVVQVHARGPHAVVVLLEVVDARAVADAQAGRALGMREQHRLEKDLVDAVRRLRRGPPGVGAAGGGVALAARGDRNARQLHARHGRAVGHVVGVVGRQARVAQRLRHAQAAEHLHRTRRHVVALHVGWLAAVADLGHQHVDAALRQVDGQRQPHGAGADDQHLGLQLLGHGSLVSRFL